MIGVTIAKVAVAASEITTSDITVRRVAAAFETMTCATYVSPERRPTHVNAERRFSYLLTSQGLE
jgi:hypothetical protein